MRCKGSVFFSLALSLGIAGTAGGQAPQTEIATVTSSPQAKELSAEGNTGQGGSSSTALQHRYPRYRLQSADVLELSFPFSPEFNQTVTLQPDGYVTLHGAENVRLEGQTIPEAVKSLKAAYAGILHEPVIDVVLKDFERPYFIVGGEVGRPGKFDLRSETRVAEAVAIAGGLKESSKHSEILLFHRVPEGWAQVRKVNLKKELNQANLDEDPYLKPGDFLYVPKNNLSKIARFIPTSSIGMYANPALH